MNIPDLSPTAPTSFHDWAVFAISLCMALFKLDRGTLMRRRAQYVDRFGLSIVVFDIVFGLTFLVVAIESLYPRLRESELLFWLTLVPLAIAMSWQWFEVRLAARERGERLHVTVAGTLPDTSWQPGDGERRTGPADRRQMA